MSIRRSVYFWLRLDDNDNAPTWIRERRCRLTETHYFLCPLRSFFFFFFFFFLGIQVVTLDALEPFRCKTSAGKQDSPVPLPYLQVTHCRRLLQGASQFNALSLRRLISSSIDVCPPLFFANLSTRPRKTASLLCVLCLLLTITLNLSPQLISNLVLTVSLHGLTVGPELRLL